MAGSDANAGTNPSAPRRTSGNAQGLYGSLSAGDTLAFCRGGVFSSVGAYLWNRNSTAANPITIRDYDPHCAGPSCVNVWGTGTEARPVIPGTWNLSSSGSHAHQEGIVLENLTTTAVLLFNDTDDVRICNIQSLNANNGINVAGCAGGTAGTPGCTQDRVVVEGSRIINASNQGVGMFANSTGGRIRNNYFYNCGYGDMFTHAIYLGGDVSMMGSTVQTDQQITGNEIHPPSATSGTALVVHGVHHGTLVENNLINYDIGSPPKPGGWGLVLVAGYGGQGMAERNDHAVVRGNTIINAGNVSLGVNSCLDCLIEDNLVINTQQATRGIMVPYNASALPDTTPGTRNTIRNNTVYVTSAGMAGITVGGEGTGHIVSNNVVQTPSGGTCYSWQSAAGSFTVRDYNASYQCSDAVVGSHSWKALPQWVAPGTNFKPTAASPLSGAGDPAQRPATDITGATRPAAPSIGAFEP
ncbi:MAG TPA: right-handed parallel beta-helix repeat-containing protein [Thermoleophilia bacterium]|nr:right-handed parallel beta-helix repeat-containing protein [Thermoleophilia bacterium]